MRFFTAILTILYIATEITQYPKFYNRYVYKKKSSELLFA